MKIYSRNNHAIFTQISIILQFLFIKTGNALPLLFPLIYQDKVTFLLFTAINLYFQKIPT